MNRRNQSGLTLIELVITLAIVGVVAAAGAPALGTFIIYNLDRLRDVDRDRTTSPERTAFVETHRSGLTRAVVLAAIGALGAHASAQDGCVEGQDCFGEVDPVGPWIDGDPANPATGRPGDAYSQLSPTSGGIDDRVVYTVAGSSGKADDGGDNFGITDDAEWLRHAAHIEQPLSSTKCDAPDGCLVGLRGLGVKGSVVIDADKKSLRARFVDVNGDVLDEFTIQR